MRAQTLVVAACLLIFAVTSLPGAEARPEPVGDCESGATVEVCHTYCIYPPCDQYVCVNSVERICTD